MEEIALHAKNPKRQVDWAFWLNPNNSSDLLRSVLIGSGDVLLHMAHNSAVQTIRHGKQVYFWEIDLEAFIRDVCAGRQVAGKQTLVLGKLRNAPSLSSITRPNQLPAHPDMITIIASCSTLSAPLRVRLGLAAGDVYYMIFEVVYDRAIARRLEEQNAPALVETFALGIREEPDTRNCFHCDAEINMLKDRFLICMDCGVALYCHGKDCREEHIRLKQHSRELCKHLCTVCTDRLPGCSDFKL